MEVLGGLIRIANLRGHLPIPWYNRSHLGIRSGVTLKAVITRKSKGAIPDIIVGPIDPSWYFGLAFRLTIEVRESTGAVARILENFKAFKNLNIAIAETVTSEGRARHIINLIVEPRDIDVANSDELSAFRSQARDLIKSFDDLRNASVRSISSESPEGAIMGFRGPDELKISAVNFERRFDSHPSPLATDTMMDSFLATFSNGYLLNTSWRNTLRSTNHAASHDLDRVVISSNTRHRYVRYVFPRKNAVSMRALHYDRPHAFYEIARACANAEWNILVSRLSRSSRAGDSRSVLYAVLEPANTDIPSREGLDRLRSSLRHEGLDRRLALELTFSEGELDKDIVYVGPRMGRMVHLDRAEIDDVKKVFDRIIEARGPQHTWRRRSEYKFVFKSKKFLRENSPQYAEQQLIEGIIDDSEAAYGDLANPLIVVDGHTDPNNATYSEELFARMNLANGCIVLAINENGTGQLTPSQAHEIGFFQGRKIPFKIITRIDRMRDATFGNMPHHLFFTYDDEKDLADPVRRARLVESLKTWFESL